VRAHLQTLRHRREAEFRGDGGAVPFHEWRSDFEDLVAVHTDDLSYLRIIIGVGEVVLEVFADIDLANEGSFRHDRERAVNGGAGHGVVDGTRVIEELFSGEMLGLGESGFEDRQPLLCHAKSFFGEVSFEFSAGGVVAHGGTFKSAILPVKNAENHPVERP
jgi:hypothetical protein